VTTTPVLLRPADVAQRLGKTIRTLTRWRAEGRGPEFIRVEGEIRYPEHELTAWLTANKSGRAS
jgi:predicted site-specific integrase-resolvase